MTAPAFLICYDIADPRRLVRVHRFLLRHAMPVQYSVFVGRFSRTALRALMAGLAVRINARQDDVRIYRIPERPDLVRLGSAALPEGVFAPMFDFVDRPDAALRAAAAGADREPRATRPGTAGA